MFVLHKAQIYSANQNVVSEIPAVKNTSNFFFFNPSKAFSLSTVLKIPSSVTSSFLPNFLMLCLYYAYH